MANQENQKTMVEWRIIRLLKLTSRKDCFTCHSAGMSTILSNLSAALSHSSLVCLASVIHSWPRRSPPSGTLTFVSTSSALTGMSWFCKKQKATLWWCHCLHSFVVHKYGSLPTEYISVCKSYRLKSWKSLLLWAFWALFSSLQSWTKEIAAIHNCQIAGWQKHEWACGFTIPCKI